MSKTTPYFLFSGTCAEAMKFYHAAFGGELTIIKAGDTPMKAQFPPELQERVIQAKLTGGGVDISASDWFHPTEKPQPGNMVCAYISGATYDEVTSYFEQLSEGADAATLEAPHEMPFGLYAACTDKFGKRWMLQGDKKES